jgi:hypothetical protein
MEGEMEIVGRAGRHGNTNFFPIFFWFAPFVSRFFPCCRLVAAAGFLAVSRDDVVVPYRATAVGFLVLGYGGSR